MGILDRLKISLGIDAEQGVSDTPTPYSPYVSRAIREHEQSLQSRFGMPEFMDRNDWDWVMQVFKLWVAPQVDAVLLETFEKWFCLADVAIAHAIGRGGEVYFRPEAIERDEMLNIAFQWAKGDSLLALQYVILVLLAILNVWQDFPAADKYISQVSKFWDFTQSGVLKNGYGQWLDFGPLKAIHLEVMRPVKVVSKSQVVTSDNEADATTQPGKTVKGSSGGTSSADDYWN